MVEKDAVSKDFRMCAQSGRSLEYPRQRSADGGERVLFWLAKNWNADLARNVAQAGCWRGWSQTEERSNGNSDRDGPQWRYPASFRRD